MKGSLHSKSNLLRKIVSICAAFLFPFFLRLLPMSAWAELPIKLQSWNRCRRGMEETFLLAALQPPANRLMQPHKWRRFFPSNQVNGPGGKSYRGKTRKSTSIEAQHGNLQVLYPGQKQKKKFRRNSRERKLRQNNVF